MKCTLCGERVILSSTSNMAKYLKRPVWMGDKYFRSSICDKAEKGPEGFRLHQSYNFKDYALLLL